MVVFGVLVGFLTAFPRCHFGPRLGGTLGRILLGRFKQGGKGVVLELQVYIGDPEKRGVSEGQVVVMTRAKSNVEALIQLHTGKAMTPCAVG